MVNPIFAQVTRYYFFFLSSLLFACNSNNDSNSKKYYVDKGNTQAEDIKNNSFSGTNTCISCHKKEYMDWSNSHHDLSMQLADATTVLGNFNDVEHKSKGVRYKFFRKDKEYFVNTEGEKGEYQDYKIAYTFGVYPLQQYLIRFEKGKVQCLLVAWDEKNKKWYDLQPNLKTHQKDWLHWTGGSMTWNNMCADCHSTNLKKNYNPKKESYNTTYSIINVSCEACHGPASSHINYYKNKKKNIGKPPPKLYIDKSTSPKELVDKCARCHSRRTQITPYFDYKGHFLDHYDPQLLIPPIYAQDGQIKDEVYVYGSYVQSKMYHNNVSCKDCHNPHSLKLIKTGNALCLNCHNANYNSYSHHYHRDNTKGAKCVNCHMTSKIYMGIDGRRDHSFRVPRPDQSEKYGTPNACNSCHKDKSPAWASAFISEKYGKNRIKNFTDDMLEGYAGDDKAFIKVFMQRSNPDITRATALNQFAKTNSKLPPNIIRQLLHDSSALVRKELIMALGMMKSKELNNEILVLAKDSIRIVRIAVASQWDMNIINSEDKDDYLMAKEDYMTSLNVNADFASGQHQIALLHQAKGHTKKAIKAYYQALKIDDYYNLSRLNLALLEYKNGNVSLAEKFYLTTIKQEPEYSYTYYLLGLLYHENGQLDKALEYLRLASERKPANIRAFYNYALLLHQKEQYKNSSAVINKGLRLFPNNQELLSVKLLNETKEK